MNRCLTLWRTGPDNEGTINDLASALAKEAGPVAWIQLADSSESAMEPSTLGRFQSASPVLFKNYLLPPGQTIARISLQMEMVRAHWKNLICLLSNAFAWTLVTGPADFSETGLTVLDHSDLLLWLTKPGEETVLQEAMAQLTSHHYPLAFSRPLLFPWNMERIAQDLRTLPLIKQAPASQKTIEDLKHHVQPHLLKQLESAGPAAPSLSPELAHQTIAACLAQDPSAGSSRQEREIVMHRVLDDVLGLGPLQPFLNDRDVTEVMVNGPGTIFVEKKGKIVPTSAQFSSEQQLRTAIDRIVAPLGRRVDEGQPLCDARLPDGSRVNIVLPPLALNGASLTIRKFHDRPIRMADLVAWGSLNTEMAEYLQRCVQKRKNIVVSGGTGSGKTTLLNALSGLIPDDERIVTIEDAAELRLQKPHVVRLESRPPNAEGEGAISIRRLVMNALRMRPDRIVVGECRGGEALDMLQAMNTGHDGSMTTLHANSPRDALSRLETMVLMSGAELPIKAIREQLRGAVHLIMQQSRMPDGSRKVTSITEVTGMEGDVLTLHERFRFNEQDPSTKFQAPNKHQ